MTVQDFLPRRAVLARVAIQGRERGVSKHEFLIRAIVAGLLAAVLLERFLYYQEYTEKTVMEATVVNMRSGMRLRIAELMTENRSNEIGNLLKENPITWLERPPANYLGAFKTTGLPDPAKDGWYFDTDRKELVYRLRLHRFFEGEGGQYPAVRFRVAAKTGDAKDGVKPGTRTEGVDILTLNRYKWFY